MSNKVLSRRFKWSLVGICFLVVAYVVASGIGTWAAMIIKRVPLQASPEVFDLVYEDVSFTSRSDEVLLKGWLMPSTGDKVIIVVNGGYQNRIDDSGATLGMTADLVAAGYSVLLFDLRGRGESEGTGNTLCHGEEDIGGAVDFIRSRGYGVDDICIIGFCSGSALSIYYVSQNDVGALILDGGFPRISTIIVRESKGIGVPAFFTTLFLPGLYWMAYLMYDFKAVNPINLIDDITCPIFFIHEEEDAFTYTQETYELYQASSNPEDEFWEIIGTGHSMGYLSDPEEYIEKITGFLERAM